MNLPPIEEEVEGGHGNHVSLTVHLLNLPHFGALLHVEHHRVADIVYDPQLDFIHVFLPVIFRYRIEILSNKENRDVILCAPLSTCELVTIGLTNDSVLNNKKQ